MKERGPGRLGLATEADHPEACLDVDLPKNETEIREAPRVLDLRSADPSDVASWGRFVEFSHAVAAAAARWPEQAEALSLVFDLVEEALGAPYPSPGPAQYASQRASSPPDAVRFDAALAILQETCRRLLDDGETEATCARRLVRCRDDLRILLGHGLASPANASPESTQAAHRAAVGRLSMLLTAAAAPRFVQQRVLRWIGIPLRERGSVACAPTIIREIGTGRATIRYGGPEESLAFGKIFTDAAQAEHSYRVQRALWEQGLNDEGPNRVPEPLAYVPEMGLVLSRAAPGRPLADLFDEGATGLEVHARRAAAWLVDLHASPVRVGGPEPLWRSMWLVRLLRRLSKAAAMSPDHRGELVGMVDDLDAFRARTFREVPPVQVHGTFHFEHVLIERDATTVLDFDRSFPTDPAKDLAEFVRFMRWRTFAHTGSVAHAEGPTRAFLREYARVMPEHAANLAVYWAAFMLMNLFRRVSRHQADETFAAELDFFRREFESILSGASLRES